MRVTQPTALNGRGHMGAGGEAQVIAGDALFNHTWQFERRQSGIFGTVLNLNT